MIHRKLEGVERTRGQSGSSGTTVAHARTSILYQRVRKEGVTAKMLRLIETGRENCGYIGTGTERP
jgi:hypothetical protein